VNVCELCGDNRSLRYQDGIWVCYGGCGLPLKAALKKNGKVKRESLFFGYWLDMEGHRLSRVSRSELAVAWRLWATHKDIREGRGV